jgi:VWFA-related protein
MGPDFARRAAWVGTALMLLLAGGTHVAVAAGIAVDAGDFPLIRLFPQAGIPSGPLPGAPPVTENAQPVPGVAALDRSIPLPLRLALVVDTSGSIAPSMDGVRHAAAAAVQRLNDADTLALIGFADQVRVLAEPTRDRRRLGQAIAGLKSEGGTALYDAIKAGVEQVLEAGGARRAVVLLTDGKDESTPGNPGSVTRLEPLKRLLSEAGVPVYILALGNEVDRGVLEEIAGASGGRVYGAARADALSGLYADVFADLRGTGGWQYISPDLSLDGRRRMVELTLPDGRRVSGVYPVPKVRGMVWRYTRTAQPGSLCSAAALSPDGRMALIPNPMALVQDNGRLLATLPQDGARPAPFERAAITADGVGFGFTGTGGAAFALTPAGRTPGAPWLAMQQAAPAGTPGAPVAASPSGTVTLWFDLPVGAAKPTFTARRGPDAAPLWSKTLGPFTACDRVTGAAVADDGSALINLTGVVQRMAPDGAPAGSRRETFFPQISLSADGNRAAGVVWRPAPKRAVLMDAKLGTVAELSLQSYLDSVPAVATVSPDGRWFAARDDFQVQLMDVASRRVRAFPLGRLRPAPACALTLAVDNTGRVLTGDGASVFLLQGMADSAVPAN